ncbi:MAG: cysteine hydrolase family protein [Gemmatimonadaceae bacterium]|nr:cysteine hydrolase family protein [Gemmatimonadaceae bacterium]
MKRPVIFWDVDTQHDFMDPDGTLYVKGAELVKPKLEQLTKYAHAHGIQIVASSDDHELEHAELSGTPDYTETFPPHCIRGTHGAEKIPETTLESPMVIEPVAIPHETLVRQLSSHEGDVLIRKHRFDVFSNPNTGSVIEAWDPTEIVIYGVTLDYCVKYAIDGLIDIGIPTIHLVLDATKPIVPESVDGLVSGWKKQDVRIVTTDDVVCGRIV